MREDNPSVVNTFEDHPGIFGTSRMIAVQCFGESLPLRERDKATRDLLIKGAATGILKVYSLESRQYEFLRGLYVSSL